MRRESGPNWCWGETLAGVETSLSSRHSGTTLALGHAERFAAQAQLLVPVADIKEGENVGWDKMLLTGRRARPINTGVAYMSLRSRWGASDALTNSSSVSPSTERAKRVTVGRRAGSSATIPRR